LNSARRRFFFGGALLFFVGMQVGGAAEISETYLSGGTRIKAERVFVREAVPSSRPLHSVSK
jgi:hypothetical protein